MVYSYEVCGLREVLLRRAVQIFAHLFDVQVLVGVWLRGVEEGL